MARSTYEKVDCEPSPSRLAFGTLIDGLARASQFIGNAAGPQAILTAEIVLGRVGRLNFRQEHKLAVDVAGESRGGVWRLGARQLAADSLPWAVDGGNRPCGNVVSG